jgi:hypothetical protein
MICNSKALGLALLAIFAMSATASSAAKAEQPAQLTAEAGFVTGTGQQIGESVYLRSGRPLTCQVTESQEAASNGDTTFSAGTPTVEGCVFGPPEFPATVRTNGCAFLFHLTADFLEAGHTWTATSDFVCPEGKKGEILVYSNVSESTLVCAYEFKTQTGLGTVDLTNEPAGGETPKDWIRAHIDISGIVSKRIFGSSLLCGGVEDATGTLTGEAELSGTDADGNASGITISTDA